MFDIWAALAELGQPCLYRPIGDRLLDPEWLVRREVLASLDRLFLENLIAGRARFQMLAASPPIPSEHRFINISALQKAIRRGDAESAIRFAQQGCGLDAEQVFRRLATCAVEDVGIGNLLAVGMSLAVMGNKAMRENGAPDELAAYLAYLLAISPKSRLACDLLSIADYDRRLDPLKHRLAKAGVADLAAEATDASAPVAHRMIAAWLLAGTARFRGTSMPKVARDRRDLMRLLAKRRVPLVLYYIADRAAARISDAMFVSMLPIAEMLASEPDLQQCKVALKDTVRIAGYQSAAIDLHTYEGRLALRRFGRECAPVAEIIGNLPPQLRDKAIGHAVFIAEGGQLSERIRFDEADLIEGQAHQAELAFAGVTSHVHQVQLLAHITAALSLLDNLRRKAFDKIV